MLRIGVTGGIAGGKSLVSATLGVLGAHVIEADDVARKLVRPGSPLLDALRGSFGDGVLNPDGTLNRRELGALVFADAEALRRLNEITHPPLTAEIMRRLNELERGDPEGVAVVDAALLPDWDILREMDLVVLVTAPEDVRVSRMVAGGLDEGEARSRIAAQRSERSYREVSDEVLENVGTRDELEEKVRRLWARVAKPRATGRDETGGRR